MRRKFWIRSNGSQSRKHNRGTSTKRRQLRAESLEKRQLLAGDFFHNHFSPEDVNDDGEITARDALAIINSMNRGDRGSAEMLTDVNDDGRQTASDALMVINRIGRDRNRGPSNDNDNALPGLIEETRSIDGTGNNLDNPELGAAGENLIRVADPDYSDSISEAAGEDRPSPRQISNTLSAIQDGGTLSERDLSAFLAVWGQFLDHDIDLSGEPEDEAAHESLDIPVPINDFLFNPAGTDDVVIPFTRSDFDQTTGTDVDNPRQQFNAITSFVDGSQVYGSDQETADALREFQGGRLLLRDNGLLPLDEDGNILAGDVRAAENISLTSMHTLFVREHNRLAEQIAADNPNLTDEEIYQQARAIVIAQLQSITYNEFLPALLGRNGLDRYDGYDSSIDPSIANEFSTGAFRFGHSTLNESIEFIDNDGLAERDAIGLAEAFFNPSILDETGIDTVLKGAASNLSQEIDLQVIDGVRNFLFGPPGAGGLDLVSLNIQRGRDHGLSDYNSTRVAYGLEAYDSFDDITSNVEVQEDLEALYGDVDNIDLWVGLLAEDHVRNASVGELTGTIIADQFQRLRDGDRFYYENVMNRSEIRMIERTSLADIIARNTDVEGLQDNVFFFRAQLRGNVSSDVLADGDQQDNRGGRDGLQDVVVELLNSEGDVIDTTTTDRRGNYRFNDIAGTGEYTVRLADSGESLDATVSTGNQQIRNLDFQIS